MTIKYENVFINEVSTITGPYEKKGPLGNLFDKSYDDFYFNQKNWEEAEIYLLEESVKNLIKKISKKNDDINLFISGDLLNQTISSNYVASKINIPFLGIYNACATSVEGLIIGSNMIEGKQINNCICSVSSHNNSAEKQFRYPVEYGGPKPKTTTFTVTGAASAFLSNEKSIIKVESSTIGTVKDMGIDNVYQMGAAMAQDCAETINRYLKETNRDINYYDMIYSGDLGLYGKKILKEYMKEEYNIDLINYDDTATIIYDLNKQPVYSGGSGPTCLPLVAYSYILGKMKRKELKKVLLVATGALMSPTAINEKMTIPSIAHAISLEVVE